MHNLDTSNSQPTKQKLPEESKDDEKDYLITFKTYFF